MGRTVDIQFFHDCQKLIFSLLIDVQFHFSLPFRMFNLVQQRIEQVLTLLDSQQNHLLQIIHCLVISIFNLLFSGRQKARSAFAQA